jgi:hypothetical protein
VEGNAPGLITIAVFAWSVREEVRLTSEQPEIWNRSLPKMEECIRTTETKLPTLYVSSINKKASANHPVDINQSEMFLDSYLNDSWS